MWNTLRNPRVGLPLVFAAGALCGCVAACCAMAFQRDYSYYESELRQDLDRNFRRGDPADRIPAFLTARGIEFSYDADRGCYGGILRDMHNNFVISTGIMVDIYVKDGKYDHYALRPAYTGP